MHVYFSNKNGYVDGVNIAKLDYDNTQGYGPETVTMTFKADYVIDNGYFNYSVHKFSSNGTLSESNAIVRLYSGNTLIDTYNVPTTGNGNVWNVFKITKDGVKKINSFTNTSSSSTIQ